MHKPQIATCLLFITVVCGGCTKYSSSVEVSDVRKEEIIILRYVGNSTSVFGLSIRGTGKINGDAEIPLILNGKIYKNEELNDVINFTWGGDWYSDAAELHYKPKNVDAGDLLIEYKFSSL